MSVVTIYRHPNDENDNTMLTFFIDDGGDSDRKRRLGTLKMSSNEAKDFETTIMAGACTTARGLQDITILPLTLNIVKQGFDVMEVE